MGQEGHPMQIATSALEVLEIVAYSAWGFEMAIVPAGKERAWMTATASRFAYHCLPMTLANQSGWFLLAPHDAVGEWRGGDGIDDLRVTIPGEAPKAVQARSAVGHGILTWTIPYLFRTPPGWNLLCRGPANHVKDGVAPLEGLVETDWSLASFSMNWKFTRPGRVEWRRGEPVAMLVPQRRAELEEFSARKDHLQSQPDLYAGYCRWIQQRQAFLEAQRRGAEQKYERHYFSGCTNAGVFFDGHQKKRSLHPFQEPEHRDAAACPHPQSIQIRVSVC
jgi:hypothetical protein